MALGKRIKELRIRKDLRQKELADKIGVGKSTVCNWEYDVNRPNPEDMAKLCKVLGITEAELFGAPALNLSNDIVEALQDPVAVKALLITHKNSEDIKMAIRHMLDCFPGLSPDKRQAILALCK